LFLQIGVLPEQSELAQQVPSVQLPLQHFCPALHWPSDVHWQLAVPHWLVTVEQHWFARQSEFEWQHEAHDPFVQHSDEGQSESAQQVASVQTLLQHFWPLGHWASVVQLQFWVPHACVAALQH
jgi:hypothetical protein